MEKCPSVHVNEGEQDKMEKMSHSSSFRNRFSTFGKETMEAFFFRYGYAVATHPWKFITICLCLTIISSCGLAYFTEENRPDKLILPENAEFSVNMEWIRTEVAVPLRENYAILTADNVLTPEVMKILVDLHDEVKLFTTPDGKSWNDACFKAPITKFELEDTGKFGRKKRSDPPKETNSTHEHDPESVFDDEFFNDDDTIQNISQPANGSSSSSTNKKWETYHSISEGVYCSIINELEEECLEFNPAEIWAYDKEKIYNLTEQQLIHAYNHELTSPVFGRKMPYKLELGGKVERNEKGEIIKAESLLIKWIVKIDTTAEMITDKQGLIGDKVGLDWESGWIKVMKAFSKKIPKRIKLYFANASCWGDVVHETLVEETITFLVGFAIMIIYVSIMIGKLNPIEQRPLLTFSGLLSVVFSLFVACGICSYLSVPFALLNRVLPFLILGIGIDDIFVIVESWNNLNPSPLTDKNKKSIPLRMGETLRHAGISITSTSATDILAFGAGAMTSIPALRSFCIYAAISVSALLFFQSTFFVAIFALDQRRLEQRRNAFFPCIKYKEDRLIKSSSVPKQSWLKWVFENVLAKFLLKRYVKIAVLITTGGLFGIGVYGNVLLKQYSDALWFIPEDSYFVQFYRSHLKNYPSIGFPGLVVANQINWTESLPQIGSFLEELETSPQLHDLMQFYTEFRAFVLQEYQTDVAKDRLDPELFNKYMGRFLFSPYGALYKYFFKFNGTFSCGGKMPPIETVAIPFRFKAFPAHSSDHIPAMNKIKSNVLNTKNNITFNEFHENDGKFFFWAQISIAWEVDEIIKGEMYKNLGLSLTCVLIATFLMLADLKLSLVCGACIIFTVVSVSGGLHWMGLTIDSLACTILILSVGLCVDYVLHICFAFMNCTGSKTQRAKESLISIGPAVFNGGISTILAISLLAFGKTVSSVSFFKIFLLVVGHGLFHGLIFCPVLLSIVGAENRSTTSNPDTDSSPTKPLKSVEMHSISNKYGKPANTIVVIKGSSPNSNFETGEFRAPLLD